MRICARLIFDFLLYTILVYISTKFSHPTSFYKFRATQWVSVLDFK